MPVAVPGDVAREVRNPMSQAAGHFVILTDDLAFALTGAASGIESGGNTVSLNARHRALTRGRSKPVRARTKVA
jgi:hypothetical protein